MAFSAVSKVIGDNILRVRFLFETALGVPEAERAAFLTEACGDNSETRTLINRMIDSEGQPFPRLDEPLFAFSSSGAGHAEDVAPGGLVGNYRIVREIGRGGMGCVYLAVRDVAGHDITANDGDAGGPPVAVKVIHWPSPEVARRFGQEQRILRRLHHANIASYVDSGFTAQRFPYFVMEYVDGVAIDEFCRERRLGVRERLALFRQVCSAARYLHQNLVVHRDFKPSNVLVTVEGTLKLVDFGIAKLLHADDGATPTLNTAGGLMTPDYASPEQIRGCPASTLTDVYSLGVLLYELLTGVRPFEEPGRGLQEKLRLICEADPVRPSSAVSPETGRRLRGELDNIVLKAMQKGPERRYASVEQFEEDIRRYMEGLPVLAQGDSALYLTRKWISRYRTGAAVAVLTVSLLMAGVAAISAEATIAKRERRRAEVHAIEAQRLRAVADTERARAEQQRAIAESQAADARRERLHAEQRLAALEGLATRAVGKYAMLTGSDVDFLESIHDVLTTLKNVGRLTSPMASALDAMAIEVASAHPPADQPWQVPLGWSAGSDDRHDFFVGTDRRRRHSGSASLLLQSRVPNPSGKATVYQSFAAERYRGRRVRLSAYLQNGRIADSGRFWIVIVGDESAGFLGNEVVTVKGTHLWDHAVIVFDIPAEAEQISFGVSLQGRGALWADDFRVEEVSRSVPLTATRQPRNLDFTETTKVLKEN